MLLPALAAKDFPHRLDAASADAVRRLPPATAAVREGLRLATAALAVESCTMGVRVSAAQLPGLAALRGEAAAILGIPPADVPELNIRGGGAPTRIRSPSRWAVAQQPRPPPPRSPRPAGPPGRWALAAEVSGDRAALPVAQDPAGIASGLIRRHGG